MADPFRAQKIQNWAADFANSDAAQTYPVSLKERATDVAEAFLIAACQVRDVEPDALSDADIKTGLLDGPGRLALPKAASAKVPDFCAAFLEMLQGQGRLPARRSLPAFVRALRAAFIARAATATQEAGRKASDAPKPKPITRPGSKLGPNDPCPCGSGKKYKKCCQRRLR